MEMQDQKFSLQEYQEKIVAIELSPNDMHIVKHVLEKPFPYVANPLFSSSRWMIPNLTQPFSLIPGKLLSREEERNLFLHYNYYRFQVHAERDRLLKLSVGHKIKIQKLLQSYRKQAKIREGIVHINIPLVSAMVRKYSGFGLDYNELVSEGSLSLICAVDRFDVSRGHKFSTYACVVIRKQLYRLIKRALNQRQRFIFEPLWIEEFDEPKIPFKRIDTGIMIQEVNHILHNNMAHLTDKEHLVLQMRFGLGARSETRHTLKKIADHLGYSKERVRQIQNQALTNVRLVLEFGKNVS